MIVTSPGNEISRVDGLTGLSNLTELVLDRNKIKVSIELNVVGMLLQAVLPQAFHEGSFSNLAQLRVLMVEENRSVIGVLTQVLILVSIFC